ncbi:hypothetical protein L1987_04012 [Smallanthus sonchifolius]|uniref:Uncharacterized protein n=1 Tax=Smallanthus sonchifolius TaxID=185202 RepID=A0ACB9KC65_9ASTR|nr:hypothetical protein L1987_04012 [Smallanthus sonchifolius]
MMGRVQGNLQFWKVVLAKTSCQEDQDPVCGSAYCALYPTVFQFICSCEEQVGEQFLRVLLYHLFYMLLNVFDDFRIGRVESLGLI